MFMHKRTTRRGLIVAAIAATIAFSSWPENIAAAGQPIVIDIHDFKFSPKVPAINPGDIIVWVNNDIVPHTVSAKDEGWDSGLIEPGGKWRMVVKDDTFQVYHCLFHPSMIARIEIGD